MLSYGPKQAAAEQPAPPKGAARRGMQPAAEQYRHERHRQRSETVRRKRQWQEGAGTEGQAVDGERGAIGGPTGGDHATGS